MEVFGTAVALLVDMRRVFHPWAAVALVCALWCARGAWAGPPVVQAANLVRAERGAARLTATLNRIGALEGGSALTRSPEQVAETILLYDPGIATHAGVRELLRAAGSGSGEVNYNSTWFERQPVLAELIRSPEFRAALVATSRPHPVATEQLAGCAYGKCELPNLHDAINEAARATNLPSAFESPRAMAERAHRNAVARERALPVIQRKQKQALERVLTTFTDPVDDAELIAEVRNKLQYFTPSTSSSFRTGGRSIREVRRIQRSSLEDLLKTFGDPVSDARLRALAIEKLGWVGNGGSENMLRYVYFSSHREYQLAEQAVSRMRDRGALGDTGNARRVRVARKQALEQVLATFS